MYYLWQRSQQGYGSRSTHEEAEPKCQVCHVVKWLLLSNKMNLALESCFFVRRGYPRPFRLPNSLNVIDIYFMGNSVPLRNLRLHTLLTSNLDTHYRRQRVLSVFIFPPSWRVLSSDERLTTVEMPKRLPVPDWLRPRTWVIDDEGRRLSTKFHFGRECLDKKSWRGSSKGYTISITDQLGTCMLNHCWCPLRCGMYFKTKKIDK